MKNRTIGNPSARGQRAIKGISIIIALLCLCSFMSMSIYAALPEVPDAITNKPFTPLSQSVDISMFENIWDRQIYDRSYTAELSELYNGTATSNHVLINGGEITFYGYDAPPFFDAVFTSEYELDEFVLDYDSRNMIPHVLKRTGFWINASISADGKISGYLVSIGDKTERWSGGAASEDAIEASQSITLYQVTDMDISAYNAELTDQLNSLAPGENYFYKYWENEADRYLYYPPIDDSTRFPIGQYTIVAQKNISMRGTFAQFRIVSRDNGFDVYMTPGEGTGAGVETLLFTKNTAANSPRGFGFWMQSYAHNCSELTRVAYTVAAKVYRRTSATVKFMIEGTDTEIATSQTENGFVGGKYNITAPAKINDYEYASASKSKLDDITYQEDAKNNVTILYYKLNSPPSPDPTPAPSVIPPKTGDPNSVLWMFGILAAGGTTLGSFVLKKRNKNLK